jgi:hypothetical protein
VRLGVEALCGDYGISRAVSRLSARLAYCSILEMGFLLTANI